MQALFIILQMIGSEIVPSDEHKAGEVNLDGSYGGCGFSVAPNFRDCLRDDDPKFG